VGVTGLSFLGVAAGVLIACLYSIWDNRRYTELSERHQGMAPPEARLPPSMIGCVILPAGLFVSNSLDSKLWFYFENVVEGSGAPGSSIPAEQWKLNMNW
jgi:hypothetical protein